MSMDVTGSEAVKAVDAQWLTTAISQTFPGAEIVECQLIDVIQGAFVKLRLRVSYNLAGSEAGLPPSLIVKGWFGRHSPDWSIPAVFNEFALIPRLCLTSIWIRQQFTSLAKIRMDFLWSLWKTSVYVAFDSTYPRDHFPLMK